VNGKHQSQTKIIPDIISMYISNSWDNYRYWPSYDTLMQNWHNLRHMV